MQERDAHKNLLRRISESDQHAFRELFNRYCHKVHAFAFKLTYSETTAEEIVQDVFMKIWLTRESLVSIEFFPSYLYTIVRNHSFNTLKRLALEETAKATLKKEMPAHHHETEETVIKNELQQVLNQAVGRLPAQQQLVYSLCHQQGMKYEEVARQLNISRLTVKTHMQQALRSIRSHCSSSLGAITLLLLFFI